MIRRIFLPSAFIFAVCLPVFTAGPAAQSTLSSVQRDLVRVEKEIEAEKKLAAQEKQKAADFEKQKAAKKEALQQQMTALDQKLAASVAELEKLKKERASLKTQIAAYAARQAAFTQQLAQAVQAMADSFKVDFPQGRDKRVNSLLELAVQLREGVVEPEEGLGRLFAVLDDALALGYDAEVYSGTYRTSAGAAIEGKFLRLGAVLSVFESADGKTVAWLEKTAAGWAWVDQGLGLSLRQSIKKALEVSEGKATPTLVEIPFGAPEIRRTK